jgi:hypothetical protein
MLALLCGCSENDFVANDNYKYDYSIEQSRSCFCPHSSEKIKLFVRADTIADAILLTDNSHLSNVAWEPYRTIKGLFNEIAYWDSVRFKVSVSYDRVYHYPSIISVDPKPFRVNDSTISVMTDVGFTIQTQNFVKYK